MPQLIRPSTTVRVVPKEGEIEITLNINITVDGKVVATAENADVVEALEHKEEEKPVQFIPDFVSGFKLGGFGKKE